jgi:diketogulonate reductase-like aldo/keto reductase
MPVVDQLECNPYLTIEPMRNYLKDVGIQMEAWFPLGGPPMKKPGEYDPTLKLREERSS